MANAKEKFEARLRRAFDMTNYKARIKARQEQFEKMEVRARHRNWVLENSTKGKLFLFIRYLFVSKEAKNIQLTEAAKDGNLKAVQLLLSFGADIDTVESGDHLHLHTPTPLLLAAEYGYLEIVKLLIEKGASAIVNDSGPLELAMENGYIEVAKLLVERGFYGRGALSIAKRKGHTDIVQLLEKAGAKE